MVRIYRSASAPPTLPSVASPVILSLDQALEREITVWARIRAQASRRYQEYQDRKRREQERAERELLILRQQQEARENAQAELEATSALATAVSVSDRIILSWEREIEEWARIRSQATKRYQKYQLESEREQDLAEHDEHLPISRQQQDAKRNFRMDMVREWLRKCHLCRAKSASERAR